MVRESGWLHESVLAGDSEVLSYHFRDVDKLRGLVEQQAS